MCPQIEGSFVAFERTCSKPKERLDLGLFASPRNVRLPFLSPPKPSRVPAGQEPGSATSCTITVGEVGLETRCADSQT